MKEKRESKKRLGANALKDMNFSWTPFQFLPFLQFVFSPESPAFKSLYNYIQIEREKGKCAFFNLNNKVFKYLRINEVWHCSRLIDCLSSLGYKKFDWDSPAFSSLTTSSSNSFLVSSHFRIQMFELSAALLAASHFFFLEQLTLVFGPLPLHSIEICGFYFS